jgi:hypothetical protein
MNSSLNKIPILFLENILIHFITEKCPKNTNRGPAGGIRTSFKRVQSKCCQMVEQNNNYQK